MAMLERAWTVLMDFAHEPPGGRCPFGLLLPVNHGEGAIVHRCECKNGHNGPHEFATTFTGDSGTFTHVQVRWYNDDKSFPIWQSGCREA